MNVLMLAHVPLFPANDGGRVRIRQLAANLARRHEVTLVCPPAEGTPDETPGFTVHAAGVPGTRQLIDPRGYHTIVDLVRKVRPDYILVEYVWQSLHANLARLAHEAPVILDAFDVVTERFRRAGSRLWPLISLLERFALRTADRVFAVSEVDRSQLVRLGAHPERTSIVPNGVDTSRFRPDPAAGQRVRERLGIAKDERLLFFFGQLDYAPNAEAVKILLMRSCRDWLPTTDSRSPGAAQCRSSTGWMAGAGRCSSGRWTPSATTSTPPTSSLHRFYGEAERGSSSWKRCPVVPLRSPRRRRRRGSIS